MAPSSARSSWGAFGSPSYEFLPGRSGRGGFASIWWELPSICQHGRIWAGYVSLRMNTNVIDVLMLRQEARATVEAKGGGTIFD